MWIKTAFGDLINTDQLPAIQVGQSMAAWSVTALGLGTPFADGTRDEMTAVLDRIARALAAGLPFLDLGKTDEGAVVVRCSLNDTLKRFDATSLRMSRDDEWYVFLYKPGSISPVAQGAGPTPDAAIANLKPTGK